MPKIEYKLANGESVPSVTQIIGATLGYGLNGLCYYNWAQGQQGFKWQYDMRRKGAIGTLVHELIEGKVSEESISALKEEQDFDIAAESFLRYCSWPRKDIFAVVNSELSLVSEELQIGGTIDLVCLDSDMRIGIIDYKTSKSVRESYLLQLAAYARIFKEVTGTGIEFAGLIHIGQHEQPKLYLYDEQDLDYAFAAFVSCLELFRRESGLKKILKKGLVKDE